MGKTLLHIFPTRRFATNANILETSKILAVNKFNFNTVYLSQSQFSFLYHLLLPNRSSVWQNYSGECYCCFFAPLFELLFFLLYYKCGLSKFGYSKWRFLLNLQAVDGKLGHWGRSFLRSHHSQSKPTTTIPLPKFLFQSNWYIHYKSYLKRITRMTSWFLSFSNKASSEDLTTLLIHPGLPGTRLIYSCCLTLMMGSAPFYPQKYLNLDNKL